MDKDIILFEMKGDKPNTLVAHRYRETNVGLHFHRNLEIYGVAEGEATVTVAGESRLLKPWQMAVVNCMEPHQYAIRDAEIFFIHIGTEYLSMFMSLYKNKILPRWLLDTEYNKTQLYPQMEPLLVQWFEPDPDLSDIKRHAISTNLLADIISRYGLINGGADDKSQELIRGVIQYIYDNYAEDISLESLAKRFYIEPKALSKKLSRCIGVNLRVFINDIRVQHALQMLNDPQNRGKTKKEIAQACGFKNMETFYRVYNRNSKYFNIDDI